MRTLPVWAALGLAAQACGQATHQPLLSFGSANHSGKYPVVPLIQGHDGALYGTTSDGGAGTNGTVFKVSTSGLDYTVLHGFSGTSGDGRRPYAGLVQASDGTLYGTTSEGGTSNRGTVFRLSPDGSGYSVLYSFTGTDGDGYDPEAELIQSSDGALYGTTRRGGANDLGAVFKVNTNGADFAVLHSFSTNASDGLNPEAGLIPGQDGAWYGTTSGGGTWGKGMLFRVGTPRATLCLLSAPDGTFNLSLSSLPGQRLTHLRRADTDWVHGV